MIEVEYRVIRTMKDGSADNELVKLLNDGWSIKTAHSTIAYIEYILFKAKIDANKLAKEIEKFDLNELFGIGKEETPQSEITAVDDTEI